MKKYLSLSIVLMFVVILTFATTASAVDSTGKPALTNQEREALKTSLFQKIQGIKKQNQDRLSLILNAIKNEKDGEKAKSMGLRLGLRQKAIVRFSIVLENFSGFKSKINTAIQKLQVKGVNVTDATGFLATADDKISSAQEKVAEINSILVTSINQLSDADKIKLKTLAEDTKTLIQDARQALKDAIKSLRAEMKIKMEGADTSGNNEDKNNTQ